MRTSSRIEFNPLRGSIIFFLLMLFYGVLSIQAQNLENIRSQKPLRFSSGLSLQTTFYHVNEIPYRRQPFNWSISGTPVLYIYGVSLPFSFYFSNQQLGFQQPFNQFGLSPTYKWATLYLGYSSVNFSDYTLAGRRFLGAGFELKPGKWRIGFIYGRFRKAIELDTVVHATPEGYLSGVANGAFARKGLAAKLGYGTDQNYLDLIFLRIADDPQSLSDSLSLRSLNPKRNSAIGIKHRFSGKNGIFWESDAALSIFTRDDNAEALDSSDIPSFLYNLFDPKATTQLAYALKSSIGYQGKAFRTSFRYKRISRDFKSMGAYYLQTDLQEIALQMSTGLFKHKLQLRGNIGFQKNNLAETRLNTTKRLIYSLYAGAQLLKNLRASILYYNYGITQRPQQSQPSSFIDTIRIDQVMKSWQFSVNYQILTSNPQTISLHLNIQDLVPLDEDFSVVNAMHATNSTLVYTLSIPKAKLNLSLVGQGIWTQQEAGSLRSIGGGVNASKAFLKGKLGTQAGVNIYNTKFADNKGKGTMLFDGGVNYRITDYWTAAFNVQFTSTGTSGQYPGTPFNETYITLGSQFQF